MLVTPKSVGTEKFINVIKRLMFIIIAHTINV